MYLLVFFMKVFSRHIGRETPTGIRVRGMIACGAEQGN